MIPWLVFCLGTAVAQELPSAPSASLPAPSTAAVFSRRGLSLGRLDRLFDGGVPDHRDAEAPSPAPAVAWDVRLRDGDLDEAALSFPRRGWTLSAGRLGIDGRSAVVAPSWYGSAAKSWHDGPGSRLDHESGVEVSYADLTARLMGDRAPAVPAAVYDTARAFGASERSVDSLSRRLAPDDPYQTHGILVTSVMNQVGRAYPLAGPLGLSWTVGQLVKTAYVPPNVQVDGTAGLRARLAGLSIGAFGGVVDNLSPIGARPLQEAVETFNLRPGLYREQSPHAAGALWGRLPGFKQGAFSAWAGERWNRGTRVREAEGAASAALLGRPATLRAEYSHEAGPAIEFDRRRVRASAELGVAPRLTLYGGVENDDILYGNAHLASNAALVGLRVEVHRGSTVSADWFRGGYRDLSPARFSLEPTLRRLNQALLRGLKVADAADDLFRDVEAEADSGQLDPKTRAALAAQFKTLYDSLASLDAASRQSLLSRIDQSPLPSEAKSFLEALVAQQLPNPSRDLNGLPDELFKALRPDLLQAFKGEEGTFDYYEKHRAALAEAVALLSNPDVWNAVLIDAGRAELLRTLASHGTIKVPLLGRETTLVLDKPAVLAACDVLQHRLSPIAPLKRSDLDPILLREAGRALGLTADRVTPDMIADKLYGMTYDAIKKDVSDKLAEEAGKLGKEADGQIAALIFSAIPPELAVELKKRFGVDLSGLLPSPNLPIAQWQAKIREIPQEVVDALRERAGQRILEGLADATAWASDAIRHEANLFLLRLLRDSEELDRLSLDRGRKMDALDLRFAMASFDKLDARTRSRAEARRARAIATLESAGL